MCFVEHVVYQVHAMQEVHVVHQVHVGMSLASMRGRITPLLPGMHAILKKQTKRQRLRIRHVELT